VIDPPNRAAGEGPFHIGPGSEIAVPDLRLVEDRIATIRGEVVSRKGGEAIGYGEVMVTTAFAAEAVQSAGSAREPAPLLMLLAASPGEDVPEGLRRFVASTRAAIGRDGRFEIRVSESLGPFSLLAMVPGHARGIAGPERRAGEWAAASVVIEVEPVGTVRGTILDADTGGPVVGARVVPSSALDSDALQTDANGAFEWRVPDSGAPCLRVTAPGYFDVTLRVPPGSSSVAFRLHRKHNLSGTVRLAGGLPVSGATVHFSAPARTFVAGGEGVASTDAEGRFEFPAVRSGEVVLTMVSVPGSSASFLRRTVPGVAAGTTDLEVTVDPSPTIGGFVVDEAGRPIEGVSVGLQAQAGPVPVYAATGADGAFLLPGLGPGRHALGAHVGPDRAEGWLPVTIPDVEAGTRDLRIVLLKGLEIAGRVVDEDGRAVLGRRIAWVDAAADPLPGDPDGSADLDSTGAFHLRGVPPGRWRLYLDGNGGDFLRMWLTGGEAVEAGARGLVLTLTSGGTIGGEVVDSGGLPVQGACVAAAWTPDSGSGKSTRTDDRGRFEIRGLPTGRSYSILLENQLAERSVSLGTRDLVLVDRSATR
jgi:hypothetical protein